MQGAYGVSERGLLWSFRILATLGARSWLVGGRRRTDLRLLQRASVIATYSAYSKDVFPKRLADPGEGYGQASET